MSDRFEQRVRAVQTRGGRRTFLQKLAFAGALIGAGGKRAGAQTQLPAILDADILNFLLNVEYLSAEAYLFATTGKGIAQYFDLYAPNTPNNTTGGRAVTFDSATKAIAAEIAQNELAHVSLLRSTITAMQATPIDKPQMDLSAFGVGFASQAEFLTLSRTLKDVGVSAYIGAMLQLPDRTVMSLAARILATESQHAGNLRSLMAQQHLPTVGVDGVDILPPPTGSQAFSANSLGLSAIRAPGEVLAVLYGAPNAKAGGFFPAGVNGVITTSTAAAPADPAIRNQSLVKFTATPSPILSNTGHGVATLTWEAPGVDQVEVRVATMNGGLLVRGGSSGEAKTGDWVTDGMTFYLQDVTGGKGLFAAYTLATVTVHVQHS